VIIFVLAVVVIAFLVMLRIVIMRWRKQRRAREIRIAAARRARPTS
jgi:uncharacterized protein YggT (Ycf19 family)